MKMIPSHLKKYIVDQNYSRYTPIDQAVWRYILRQLRDFLSRHAHPCYMDGLEKTGVTVDKIPTISEISEKLEKFGWRAVPVSGFIPPAAFMEMQAHSILPIASDMRTIGHLMYTPAPDIVHEAAGHAPILVNPEFAKYLKAYAAVAKNAIISKEDLDVYEAIRVLSDVKEDPASSKEQIQSAEQNLSLALKNVSYISEASLLSRMNWWTAEYGLIGDIEQPKIFGAGLLSSLSESRDCLTQKVKKIPLSIDCINYTYDITEPQPQLFVTPDFNTLIHVLNEMALQMAFKKGGKHAIQEVIKSKIVNTVELDSGIQISGLWTDFIEIQGQPIYIKTTGSTHLGHNNEVLPGQTVSEHQHGYSTPVGELINLNKSLSDVSPQELIQLGLEVGKTVHLHFKSGIQLKGILQKAIQKNGKWLIFTFEKCTVNLGEKILFQPEWGVYDLAVGSQIKSAYAGAIDKEKFGSEETFKLKVIPPKIFSKQEIHLHSLYQKIRDLRQKSAASPALEIEVESLILNLSEFPNEWLPLVELLEIVYSKNLSQNIENKILNNLNDLKNRPEFKEPIEDGLRLAKAL